MGLIKLLIIINHRTDWKKHLYQWWPTFSPHRPEGECQFQLSWRGSRGVPLGKGEGGKATQSWSGHVGRKGGVTPIPDVPKRARGSSLAPIWIHQVSGGGLGGAISTQKTARRDGQGTASSQFGHTGQDEAAWSRFMMECGGQTSSDMEAREVGLSEAAPIQIHGEDREQPGLIQTHGGLAWPWSHWVTMTRVGLEPSAQFPLLPSR